MKTGDPEIKPRPEAPTGISVHYLVSVPYLVSVCCLSSSQELNGLIIPTLSEDGQARGTMAWQEVRVSGSPPARVQAGVRSTQPDLLSQGVTEGLQTSFSHPGHLSP